MDRAGTINVALGPDIAAELCAAVDSGDYDSVDAVVLDALRDWLTRRELCSDELRRLIQEGVDSGSGLDARAVFAGLRARFGDAPTG